MREVIYEAGARKENGRYYPVVKFYSSAISDSLYLTDAQPTRSKALTVARNKIKELKQKDNDTRKRNDQA